MMYSRREIRKAVRKVLHQSGNSKKDKTAHGEALTQRRRVKNPVKQINSLGLDSSG